jgi:hypothetical protein
MLAFIGINYRITKNAFVTNTTIKKAALNCGSLSIDYLKPGLLSEICIPI